MLRPSDVRSSTLLLRFARGVRRIMQLPLAGICANCVSFVSVLALCSAPANLASGNPFDFFLIWMPNAKDTHYCFTLLDELTASAIRCLRRKPGTRCISLVMSRHSKPHPSRSSGSIVFLLPSIPLQSSPMGQRWYSARHVWHCPGRSEMQQLSSWMAPEMHGADKKRELTSRTYVAMLRASMSRASS